MKHTTTRRKTDGLSNVMKNPPENRRAFHCVLIVTLVFIFACGFGFLAALHAGALIELLFTQISQNAGLCAAALETLQRVIQRLVLLDVNLRHLFPSLRHVKNNDG